MAKLIRNLETERNKEQEDSFENSLNLSLFFDSNKIINKVDSWNITNIKRICKNQMFLNNVIFEYSKWNTNIQFLVQNSQITNKYSNYKMTEEDKKPFLKKDIKGIHNWITKNTEKEKQFSLVMFLSLKTKNNKKTIKVINNVVNKGIGNLEMAIEFILPIFLMEGNNE